MTEGMTVAERAGLIFAEAQRLGLAALGLLLFVMPGIILIVRWMPLYVCPLVDGEGLSSAFSKSWAITAMHFWPILIACVPAIFLSAARLAGVYFTQDVDGAIPLLPSLTTNALATLRGMALIVISVAIFSLLRERGGVLAEIFD